jgi:hypothetical protein
MITMGTALHEWRINVIGQWTNPYLPAEVGHRLPNMPHVEWRDSPTVIYDEAYTWPWSNPLANPLANVQRAWTQGMDHWSMSNGTYTIDSTPRDPLIGSLWSMGTHDDLVIGNGWSMGRTTFVVWLMVTRRLTNDRHLLQSACAAWQLGHREPGQWVTPPAPLARGSDLRRCRATKKGSDLRLCRDCRGGGYVSAPPRCQLQVFTYGLGGPSSLTRHYADGSYITAGHRRARPAAYVGSMEHGSWVVGSFPWDKVDKVPGHSPNGTPRWAKFAGSKGRAR